MLYIYIENWIGVFYPITTRNVTNLELTQHAKCILDSRLKLFYDFAIPKVEWHIWDSYFT